MRFKIVKIRGTVLRLRERGKVAAGQMRDGVRTA